MIDINLDNINLVYKETLDNLEKIDAFIRDNQLENTQEFLNFQDSINEISVR